MNVCIIGGTGFIGQNLKKYFLNKGYNVFIISRLINQQPDELKNIFEETDIILNFSGESIYGRWTKLKKKKIYDSRIKTTEKIFSILGNCKKVPELYIQASAIGIYNEFSNNITSEQSTDFSDSFLANVVKDWEGAAIIHKNFKTRIVLLRLGVVLGKEGGFFKKLLPMLKLKVGLFFNKDKNRYFSFIYIKEIGPIIDHIINKKMLNGTINAVSNIIISYYDFFNLISKKYKLKVKFWLPDMILKIILGEAALPILSSYKVIPDVLINSGYNFKYCNIENIVSDLENNS